MKPAPFEYHAPTTIDGAVQLLADLGDEAKVLAGGQSLVPMLNMRLTRFDALVDIGRVDELRHIERTNGTVTLGAMVAQCEVERDATVAAGVPLLAKATPLIGPAWPLSVSNSLPVVASQTWTCPGTSGAAPPCGSTALQAATRRLPSGLKATLG